MSKKTQKGTARREPPPRKSNSRVVTAALVIVVLIAGVVGAIWFQSSSRAEPAVERHPEAPLAAKESSYEVVGSFPHDPDAFLQGLVWHNGFYESTGQLGHSSVRRVDFQTGKVLQRVNLDSQYFGEGLAMVDDRLVQLTWQSHRGFVYDRETLSLLREFEYNTEGWGLTFDGKALILSDGTDVLTFLDPASYKPIRRLSVAFNGSPLRSLNELEFIEGQIWANVWHTDRIVRIDPQTGNVTSYLNLSGLLPLKDKREPEAVLNGIAYDSQGKRIFVGGKLWPRIFEIRLK